MVWKMPKSREKAKNFFARLYSNQKNFWLYEVDIHKRRRIRMHREPCYAFKQRNKSDVRGKWSGPYSLREADKFLFSSHIRDRAYCKLCCNNVFVEDVEDE